MNSLIGLQVTSLDTFKGIVHGEIIAEYISNKLQPVKIDDKFFNSFNHPNYFLVKFIDDVCYRNINTLFIDGVNAEKTDVFANFLKKVQIQMQKEKLEEDIIAKKQKEEENERERIASIRDAEIALQRKKNEELRRVKEERDKIERELIRKIKEETRTTFFELLDLHLNSDFISANSYFEDYEKYHISTDEFEKAKTDFVKKWFSQKFKGNEKYRMPDNEQIAAIAAVNGNIQVVARAGSGKTTTLVNRALFLMEHCGVAANQMLMLAFNKKAAVEIRKKLLIILNEKAEAEFNSIIEKDRKEKERRNKKTLDNIEANAIDEVAEKLGIALPHIMTFHALAYAMVHPDGDILFDSEHNQTLSREVQNVVDAHLEISIYHTQIRDVMMAHFRDEWKNIEEGGYDKNRAEFLEFRRNVQKQSLGGEYVKSYGEKLIADFLFEHDISYKYERNHWWSGINYRPDFTIFKNQEKGKERGVIIEYFGLVGDKTYDEEIGKKRKYWEQKNGWDLIEISPSDVAKNSRIEFHSFLKGELEQYDIKCVKLSEDEIWERLKKRAIDRFTKVMGSFIGRCRKLSLSENDLQDKIDKYLFISPDNAPFLLLAHRLYVSYVERLEEIGADDFDGLMQKAANQIDAGFTLFNRKSGDGDLKQLRYIFVDEYQDFSDLFFRLLSTIRSKNPTVELFCVGDDWQAINGFAGADLRFFTNFNEYIPQSRKLYISTNYRSVRSIVKIGNALMKDFGKPAIASKEKEGTILIVDLDKFDPNPVEKKEHSGDIITPCVLRIINKTLSDGLDVIILCRRNGIPFSVHYEESKLIKNKVDYSNEMFLQHIRSFFPKELQKRITISTTHKYKGLEKSVVIVLDAVNRSYPLIHPDWVFNSVFGDTVQTITQEERRLFYVALTRAIDTLIIFTKVSEESPFLLDIKENYSLNYLKWDLYPRASILNEDKKRLIIQVTKKEPFEVKEKLKAEGYKFNGIRKLWERDYPVIGFDINTIQNQIWVSFATSAEILVVNEENELQCKYRLNSDYIFEKSSN